MSEQTSDQAATEYPEDFDGVRIREADPERGGESFDYGHAPTPEDEQGD